MTELQENLKNITSTEASFESVVDSVRSVATDEGYTIVEENITKPWGAYFRIESSQAEKFITTFFPDLSLEDARLGVADAELSPKFLIVKPGARLSWQYHHRRAERWKFITDGAYRKSSTDEESKRLLASPGEVVQFQTGERHRLEGMTSGVVLVAEIWQHSDALRPSDEDDIIRVSDDYQR